MEKILQPHSTPSPSGEGWGRGDMLRVASAYFALCLVFAKRLGEVISSPY